MSITTLKKLHIKPRNLISLEKEVERNLTNTPDLIITYPPLRELIVIKFWNQNMNEYNQLINDFSELIEMNNVTIKIRDNLANPANYNNNPKNVLGMHRYFEGKSEITTAMQNVSNLCHEFAHVYDNQKMNPSNDQSFHELNQEVKKLTKKLFRQSFTHLRTGPNQLTYELR